MKILILANSAWGLHDFRKELMEELAKRHEVSASTPFDMVDKIAELQKTGCRIIETPVDRRGMNPLKDFSLILSYRGLFKEENPDFVLTYTVKPNIYGGAVSRLKKVPYGVNITGLGTAFKGNTILRKAIVRLYRFSLKKAKVVFFENSENLRLFLNEKIIRPEQAKLLNGAGVNLEKFAYMPYPEDDRNTRFLFMGRMMAEKGVDELFEAIRLLRREGCCCSLDMLGNMDEDWGQKIRDAEKEGWLRYHGYQSDVRPFIRDCHCFVLPSWHEGMANTNLECAASGRPVITSDIPGCREAVLDGISGYTARPKDARDLAEKMKRFMLLNREERSEMGRRGREYMEKQFDKRVVVSETVRELMK